MARIKHDEARLSKEDVALQRARNVLELRKKKKRDALRAEEKEREEKKNDSESDDGAGEWGYGDVRPDVI